MLRVRWKILLATTLPLVALAIGGLLVVERTIARRVHENIRDDLRRAAAVFETMVSARHERLAVAGRVIVADPRFFSVLTLPADPDDPQLRATVSGVATTFHAITTSDLFEVLDAREELLASVGPDFTSRNGRAPLVRAALAGRPVAGILVDPHAHYQVSVTPVVAGDRVVGALLLGDRIGRELAEELRTLTRSEVSFFSGARSTGSTLEAATDRDEVLASVQALGRGGANDRDGTVLEMKTGSHTYLTLARELPHAARGTGQLFVLQRALDVETAFLRNMQTTLIEIGLLAIALSLLAGFLIAERITSPLRNLVRGAEEMERGNYEYPLDVTDRDEIGYLTARFREMRQRQRQHVKSLEQLARLKSDFIAVASHELRTPISVIRGYQELMAQGSLGEVSPQQGKAVEAIGRAVHTLSRIAEDATRMAQLQNERLSLAYEVESPRHVLERAVHEVRAAAAGREVAIVIEVPETIGVVRVDGHRMAQALAHLIANGVRFTPDGGRVTASARREGATLVVEVADTGVGMEDARLASIAERSVVVHDAPHHHSSNTLEFNSAGLGLGLAIARGIVEHHGGSLEVRSAPGAGTTVTVRVPVAPEVVEEAA